MAEIQQDIPKSRRHRNAFVAIVTAVSIALYFLDLFLISEMESPSSSAVLKQHGQILRSILENLIAGAIAAVLLALLYRTVVNLIDPADKVLEIERGSITSRLVRNAAATRTYIFIGNTASFVGKAILPVLVDTSRATGQSRAITLYLLDPACQDGVVAYANYKNGLRLARAKMADQTTARWVSPGPTGAPESEDMVIAKILATIYLAAYAAIPAGIQVKIYVRPWFTPSRADISDREVVLTQESASESAVAFSSQGHFFSWYQKEAEAQREQATLLDLTALKSALRQLVLAAPSDPASQIEAALVRGRGLFPHLHSLLTRVELIQTAAKLVANPVHPYQ